MRRKRLVEPPLRPLIPRERQFLNSFLAQQKREGRRIWIRELDEEQRKICDKLESLGFMKYCNGWEVTDSGLRALADWRKGS